MISAQIFTTALKFAAHAAAKKDVRLYLLGTLFEFKDGTLTLVATDGARLAYTRLQLDASSLIEDRFVVSTAGVKQVLVALGKSKGRVSFYASAEPKQPGKPRALSIGDGTSTISPAVLDGTYPDWRRVVPASDRENKPAPHLDATYLAEAAAALAPMSSPYKAARALDINAHGPGYPVVFRPAALSDPAIKEAAVVVSPVRA